MKSDKTRVLLDEAKLQETKDRTYVMAMQKPKEEKIQTEKVERLHQGNSEQITVEDMMGNDTIKK